MCGGAAWSIELFLQQALHEAEKRYIVRSVTIAFAHHISQDQKPEEKQHADKGDLHIGGIRSRRSY